MIVLSCVTTKWKANNISFINLSRDWILITKKILLVWNHTSVMLKLN